MLNIDQIFIDGAYKEILVDTQSPRISLTVSSDKNDCVITQTTLRLFLDQTCVWEKNILGSQTLYIPYDGKTLLPLTRYRLDVITQSNHGDSAEHSITFLTARFTLPWKGQWISDSSYQFKEKTSPQPFTFRKLFSIKKAIAKAFVTSTALGIYEMTLNGKKVGNDYFAPGLTSYQHQIQYQVYDVTSELQFENEFQVVVAGGWAVGSFNYIRTNKIANDIHALKLECLIFYQDGTQETIVTDENWEITLNGRYQMAEWYDGETYDASIDQASIRWKKANIITPRYHAALLAQYGESVRHIETLKPISVKVEDDGEIILDFGQNFAGVICAKMTASHGQIVEFSHAEVLHNGRLFTKSLRTAKAKATYIATTGEQVYSPRLTYMGFRYVGVKGIALDQIDLSAFVLHSELREIGTFSCSNPLLNQLQSNIRWGGKSNFVDIPTDCPQRDERQGWTGDIAMFASTACFLFDMQKFLIKWLKDMQKEQGKGGGIPMVVPRQGDKWPVMATSAWGDSCILVPWALYQYSGDQEILRSFYPMMKKFMKAARFWQNLFSVGKHRYIWRFPFHFADWCAPNETAAQWIKKGPWVATSYFVNSANIMNEIANILGLESDQQIYQKWARKATSAYRDVFTDGKGKLKREFQTAYVLPLHFKMTTPTESNAYVENLARLIRDADNHLQTGFTGTPYILFALADYGRADVAFDVLNQDTVPSWLYEVKAGGTTIWERWDALRSDGTINTGDLMKPDQEESGGMVSFNHYANGAVGDFLYKRVVGIEPLTPGYKTFKVAPIIGGGLTHAEASIITMYGKIEASWAIVDQQLIQKVTVPVGTKATVHLPSGAVHEFGSGQYVLSEAYIRK